MFLHLLSILLIPSSAVGAPLPDVIEPLRTGDTAKSDAAVVIGLERYAFLPEVPFANRDANAFFNFLRFSRGIPEDQIQLLAGSNREQILAALERATRQVGPGGRLWVYFAGHGGAAPATGERLLLGDDAKVDSTTWMARAVSLTEMTAAVRGHNTLIVLDACFTGTGRSGDALTGERFAIPTWVASPKDDVTIWAATSSSQPAAPFGEVGHGLFTYFVVGALRGWADGKLSGTKDGLVTLDEAQAYAASAMRFVRAGGQQPEVVGSKDIVLTERAQEDAPDLAALTRAAVTEDRWKFDAGTEHVVQFSSTPSGATVSVDDAYLCDTPCARALAAGRHRIELSLERYDPMTRELDVYDVGQVQEELVPRFGFLRVVTEPPGVTVRVGDRTYTTPADEILVGFGKHKVEVEDPFWKPMSQQVEVGKGERKVVDLIPEPRVGGLKVVVRDPNNNDLPLEVSVDGRRVGRAPWTGEVQVGKHTVEAGDDRKAIEIQEAEIEQVVLTAHKVGGVRGDIFVISGSAVGAAGLVVGSLAWAQGAAPDSDASLASTQLANTLGWVTTGLGASCIGFGVGRGLDSGTLSRSALAGGAIALGAGGAALGVASGVMGRQASSPEEFARLRTLNTGGWALAAIGGVTGVTALMLPTRSARDVRVRAGLGSLSVEGAW
jgi:hypothetical protein